MVKRQVHRLHTAAAIWGQLLSVFFIRPAIAGMDTAQVRGLASKIDERNNSVQIRKIPESSDGVSILGCVASVGVCYVLCRLATSLKTALFCILGDEANKTCAVRQFICSTFTHAFVLPVGLKAVAAVAAVAALLAVAAAAATKPMQRCVVFSKCRVCQREPSPVGVSWLGQ